MTEAYVHAGMSPLMAAAAGERSEVPHFEAQYLLLGSLYWSLSSSDPKGVVVDVASRGRGDGSGCISSRVEGFLGWRDVNGAGLPVDEHSDDVRCQLFGMSHGYMTATLPTKCLPPPAYSRPLKTACGLHIVTTHFWQAVANLWLQDVQHHPKLLCLGLYLPSSPRAAEWTAPDLHRRKPRLNFLECGL